PEVEQVAGDALRAGPARVRVVRRDADRAGAGPGEHVQRPALRKPLVEGLWVARDLQPRAPEAVVEAVDELAVRARRRQPRAELDHVAHLAAQRAGARQAGAVCARGERAGREGGERQGGGGSEAALEQGASGDHPETSRSRGRTKATSSAAPARTSGQRVAGHSSAASPHVGNLISTSRRAAAGRARSRTSSCRPGLWPMTRTASTGSGTACTRSSSARG